MKTCNPSVQTLSCPALFRLAALALLSYLVVAEARAQTSLEISQLRLHCTVLQRTTKLGDAKTAEVSQLREAAAAAMRKGQNGLEFRDLSKAAALLEGRPWSAQDEFIQSLVLATDAAVCDPVHPLVGRLTQRFPAARGEDVGPNIPRIVEFFSQHQREARGPEPTKTQPAPAPAGERSPSPPAAPRGTAPEWVTQPVTVPRLQQRIFESKAAKSKVSYFIYTPALYDTEKERRFPVLYWLHGTGGGLPGLPMLVPYFDAAIRAGKIPPMLVVFPNGLANSQWCDSKDGSVPMETIVIKELLPHMDASFRTIASREGRLIEGFSMGGYGAARLGFKYHDLFGAISFIGSGPLQEEFNVNEAPRFSGPRVAQRWFTTTWGDQEYFKAQSPWVLAEQNAAALRSKTRIRQIVGDRDETYPNNRKFDTHLTELKIPHAFTALPEVRHDVKAVLNALGESNWEFYRAVFGAKASTEDR